MPLTIADKSAVRRHLNYPLIGNVVTSPGGGAFAQGFQGYRFFQAYGQMEFKLNNLAPDEEARITGRAYGAAAFIGAQPNQGDTVSLVLQGGPIPSPQTVSVTAGAPVSGQDMRLPLVQNLASKVAQNTVLQSAGLYALAPYGTGPWAQNAVPVPEISILSPSNFQISGSGTGAVVPQITATGVQLEPTCSLDGGNTTLWGYLPILNALESAYLGTSDNLDTAKADVWTARSNEAGQRRSLLENWKQIFADFLGVELFKDARQRPRRSGAVNFV